MFCLISGSGDVRTDIHIKETESSIQKYIFIFTNNLITISDEGAKETQWEKDCLFNKLLKQVEIHLF